MQQQMARLLAELDSENFRRRVEAVRAAQTAPGGDSTVDTFAENSEPTSKTVAANTNNNGEGSSSGGLGDKGVKRGDATVGDREGIHISRYRHREVFHYKDVFSSAWPTDDPALDDFGTRCCRKTLGGQNGGGTGGGGAAAATPAAVGGLSLGNVSRFPVCHEFSTPLPVESRMSFTILNLSGQRIRYFQSRAGEETRHLQYLRVRWVVATYTAS